MEFLSLRGRLAATEQKRPRSAAGDEREALTVGLPFHKLSCRRNPFRKQTQGFRRDYFFCSRCSVCREPPPDGTLFCYSIFFNNVPPRLSSCICFRLQCLSRLNERLPSLGNCSARKKVCPLVTQVNKLAVSPTSLFCTSVLVAVIRSANRL